MGWAGRDLPGVGVERICRAHGGAPPLALDAGGVRRRARVGARLRLVRGTGARIVPWLQDFTLGVDYGPDEVRAQIDAAAKAGAPEFILWHPLVTHTADALAPAG